MSHLLNPLRAVAGLILLAFGASAAAAGHWELPVGFAIGGGAVLAWLGRVFARVIINPDQEMSLTSTKSSTLVLGVVTTMLPLAIGGVVAVILGGPFLLLIGGITLSAAFSILMLYGGLLAGMRRAVAASF